MEEKLPERFNQKKSVICNPSMLCRDLFIILIYTYEKFTLAYCNINWIVGYFLWWKQQEGVGNGQRENND